MANGAPGLAGGLSLDDLENPTARSKRDGGVRGLIAQYEICGAGPPSGGAIAVIETLGMLQHFDMAALGPNNVQAMHLFAEASRRAFADRDAYVGDPAFVDVPVKGLIDPAYLKARAQTIDADRVAALKVPAGDPPGRRADAGPSSPDEVPGTSDMSVIDAAGNGVSFTTTVNGPFGAHLMAGGFILNDQLTDFSFRPEQDGRPAANAVAAGKRPRSSMAPLIVFDHTHHLRLLIGSPGGSKIIDYVALAMIAHLDWGMGIQQAVDWGHLVNTGMRTELKAGTPSRRFRWDALRRHGPPGRTDQRNQRAPSAIAVLPDGLHGGADWRREGVALGE